MSRLPQLVTARPAAWVFAGLLAAALLAGRNVPWTDDARFYVPAASAYGEWLEQAARGLVTLDFTAFARPQVDAAFRHNHEHPPVAKYVMAAGWLVLHHWTGWLDEVSACRFGVILLWAWSCALVFALLHRARRTAAGLFAALALATMPRVLFHGQVETLDLPVTALLLATGAALLRCLEKPRLTTGLWTVFLFGLALGTKLNAPFFLVGAAAYLLVLRPPRLEGRTLRLAPVPLVAAGMLVVSPLVAWGMWPWLWFSTTDRLQAYLQFHLRHYGILFYYRGQLYGNDVAPWYAPWSMTALTVPLPILALGVAALWPVVRATVAHLRSATTGAPSLLERDAGVRLGLFALLQMLAQLVAVSLPGVPVYGGVKLFLPTFPFLALLAGVGFDGVVRELARLDLAPRRRALASVATAAVLLAPGALGAVVYRGAWLSYYNELAGGVRGAVAAGQERQYYDLAYDRLARDLAELLPDGGGVAVLPNPKEYSPYLARWRRLGRVPRGAHLTTPEHARLLVLTHERRWRDYPELMARFRTRPLLARLDVAGVPLYSVYDLRVDSPAASRSGVTDAGSGDGKSGQTLPTAGPTPSR